MMAKFSIGRSLPPGVSRSGEATTAPVPSMLSCDLYLIWKSKARVSLEGCVSFAFGVSLVL